MSGAAPSQMEGLQSLSATHASTRRVRPPAMHSMTGPEGNRVPLKAAKIQRQPSKVGLRALFGRNKVEKSHVAPVQEESTPASAQQQETLVKEVGETLKSESAPLETTSDAPTTPQKPVAKHSLMNMRSIKQSKPVPKVVPKNNPQNTTRQPTRSSSTWDPPPLFQAYPQAIKYAQLSASSLSADSIIRFSHHKRNSSIRDELNRGGDGPNPNEITRKAEKSKLKHKNQISGTGAAWTEKIYVLVTNGYLLQYSGEGSFDRLPEKMMQLGKDSVVFASDAIPGKHWVLQISQAMDADGTPAADSRSLFSRLTFRNADYRRTATSLLLVLKSAEEMDSWIAVVRREIEALGGKKHVSETGKPNNDEVQQFEAQSGPRFMQQDADQCSTSSSPILSLFPRPPWTPGDELEETLEILEDTQLENICPELTIPRPPTGHESTANSIISHDGNQLDNLRYSTIQLDDSRDGTNRFSCISSGQRTLLTSQGSSTAGSPRESFSTFDDYPVKLSTEDIRPRPNAYAINERRRSMQTMQIPLLDAQPKPFRPHSTFGVPNRPPRPCTPPQTPNFSVPTFSSKRISVRGHAPEPLQIPTITTTTMSKTMGKGMRKSPPPALNIARPLSTVTDSSPRKGPPTPALTPDEPTSSRLQQVRSSLSSYAPRTPQSPSTLSSRAKRLSQIRNSSLQPRDSQTALDLNFQFPRRISSMQALREALKEFPGMPKIDTTPPVDALILPLPPSPPLKAQLGRGERGVLEEKPQKLPALRKETSRRPVSMQLQSTKSSPSLTASNKPNPISVISPRSPQVRNRPAAHLSLASPMHRHKLNEVPRSLNYRKSMPMLVNGPPPAPPPDCALPPLPPGSAGMRSPMMLGTSKA